MSATALWKTEGVLGGQFFFSISNSEASTTEKFCSTMARELAHHLPELAQHVAHSISQNPAIMRSSFGEQFRTLITGPLRHRQKRVILVIDAIDECKSGAKRKELLETLVTATRESTNLRIFITSRPDPVIEAVLQPLSIKSKLEDRLHDVNHEDNFDDIAVYINRSLDGVLSESKRQRLVEQANGLFIWASTACQMLTSPTSLSAPEDIYNRLTSMGENRVIDDIYNLIFERTDPAYYRVMCEMLSLLLAAFEPFTVDDLDDLLKHAKVPGSAKALVQGLGSVLTRDPTTNTINFRHYTLVEYLERCCTPSIGDSNKIHLDMASAHGRIASWCFKHLKSRTEGLKFNICRIESSFDPNWQIPDIQDRISKFVSRRLQYASVHWLFHMAGTDDNWRRTLKNDLRYVIQAPYVFYWMEILSLTEEVPRAITGLRAAMRHTALEMLSRERMDEIRRFIIAFLVPIRDRAPHIYISALPFSPIDSVLFREGLDIYVNTLRVDQGLEAMYPGFPAALRGHDEAVHAAVFSPDSSQIVSCSADQSIQLWDADTGQPLGEPICEHEDAVVAVAFSPEGSRIVSGSEDWTIRLWDTGSRQPLGEPLRGHEDRVSSVAFSPDGSQIVSGSYDKTIRVWDAETGQSLGEPFRGHEDRVSSVAFSPDGSRAVSGSYDMNIRMWDVETGQPLGEPLRGHEMIVRSVAFSPDGSQIISGSDDRTIRLWDADSGQPLGQLLRGHKGFVEAVAFSPGGSRVASGSDDCTVRLWDVEACQQLGEPFHEHEAPVSTVAFSPGGSRVVYGSWDSEIRVLDAETGRLLGDSGHEYLSGPIAFSPDGSQIVSASDEIMIRLWDAETGQPQGGLLLGHERRVHSVVFSPDGSKIVSGSSDKTIRLWSVERGQALGEPLRGHKDIVSSVAFSSDGSYIISGSHDKTIRIWDVESGESLGESLCGHEKEINSVACSPLGLWIVSGSRDNTIRVWDAETRQPLGEPLRGHEDSVWAVAFSPDSSRIVSGSQDKTIRLWNPAIGQMLGEPLRGHEASVNAVAFSPDGSQIVSSSDDSTIRLWNVHTGQSRGVVLEHGGYFGVPVAFSPDGSRIVCSFEGTIQLWTAEIDADATRFVRYEGEPSDPDSTEDPGIMEVAGVTEVPEVTEDPGYTVIIPGFDDCSLYPDGWVRSAGKLLFWAPPDNRHGLLNPRLLLTLPKSSSLRATKLDFSRFQCGSSWTNVRTDAN
ncbi:hypothetical protein PIIN_05083 [Serendipita indica DSM 11827]|uniref:Nephrocystin 3-like N-terminal domain-containing protein n=1 Tax=Serendipita indica (strain DSM 11827) TaxID=1109443 RepID=G4TIK5_SERID|nr:hypothetical protein PIIN_05083 [Serendipita indica DSM 11827]